VQARASEIVNGEGVRLAYIENNTNIPFNSMPQAKKNVAVKEESITHE
jgi:hypothetical protein